MSRRLYDVAHCRAGDKGNTSILSLIAYRADDYPLLVECATVEAVATHLQGIVLGEITRFYGRCNSFATVRSQAE